MEESECEVGGSIKSTPIPPYGKTLFPLLIHLTLILY